MDDIGDFALDICANLLSEKKYEAFIYEIFQHSKGEWSSVINLLYASKISDVKMESDIYVTWLDIWCEEPGFCLIIFCQESTLESSIAIYNKERLIRKFGS